MKQWLADYWHWIAILLLVASGWRKQVVEWVQSYRGMKQVIHQTREDYTHSIELKLEEVNATCTGLISDLQQKIREEKARDDIEQQDRAMIRALKARMDQRGIDYSDIIEELSQRIKK